MTKNIVLACSECGSRNYKTTASNNERNTRLELKKFCSKCKNHTIHRES